MNFDGEPTSPTDTLLNEAERLVMTAEKAEKQADELEAESERLRIRGNMLRAFAKDHMAAIERFEQKAKELQAALEAMK